MREVGDSGIVTPEAVRLEFEDAGIGSRAVAIAIDWAIQLAMLLAASFAGALVLQGVGLGLPAWAGIVVMLVVTFLVLFGYPIAFETLNRGRSPGKMALGLRVVTAEGGPVTFRHAALRAALALVDFGMTSGFVAVLTSLLSSRSQRLGDHVAGTVVVRERTGAGRASAATFAVPRGHESYAATIDPAGLRPEDYQAVRAFLLRASALPPDRRAALGQRLAAGVAARISHRIPDGVHPEAFLQCVAARSQGYRGTPDGGAPSPGQAAPSLSGGWRAEHSQAAPSLSGGGRAEHSQPPEDAEPAAEDGAVADEREQPRPQGARGGFTAPN